MASPDAFAQPYLDVVDRVGRLALDAGPSLDAVTPACPDWTAGTTIAHLAGLAEDWVAGRLDAYGSEDWTSAQLGRFDGRPVAEVVTSWRAAAAELAELTESPLGGTPSMWAFGDAVVHEADLRPVLDPGSRVPDEPMAMGLKAAIARLRHHYAECGLPPLSVETPDGDRWPIGQVEDAGSAMVTAERYELFRALFGRRSASQVAAWEWSVAPDAYIEAGLPSPFRWADRDLND